MERAMSSAGSPMRLIAIAPEASIRDVADLGVCIYSRGLGAALTPRTGDSKSEAHAAYRVVSALWAAGAVLPGGVDCVFDGGVADAETWLTERATALRGALDRVAGRGDFVVSVRPKPHGVRVSDEPLQLTAPGRGGAAFLNARAEARQAAETERRALHMAIEALRFALASSPEVMGDDADAALPVAFGGSSRSVAIGPDPIELRSAPDGAYDLRVCAPLAAKPAINAALNAALTAAALDPKHFEIIATGPWPPYGYASAALRSAPALRPAPALLLEAPAESRPETKSDDVQAA